MIEPGEEGWVAQAFEGVLSARSHSVPGEQPTLAAAAVIEACRLPLGTSLVHLAAERFETINGPDQVDQLLEILQSARVFDRDRLAALGRWICEFGVTMNQLKVGLALLGIAGSPRDAGLVSLLGLFDVLTLYSVVALRNLLKDPFPAILDLAKQSSGWGRIHALRRLSETTDPAIRDWILRGGYDSGVIVEETAYIGATAGDLAAALQGSVDDELLNHAGILLAALARGGPAEDMSYYADGEISIELYLNELATAPVTMERLRSLDTIAVYLDGRAVMNTRLTAGSRSRLASLATVVLARPEWRDMIGQALYGDVLADVRAATQLAGRFGFDPKPVLMGWIERVPHDTYIWYWLARTASRDELLDLFDLAQRLLPVSALPTGASRSLGLGPEFASSQCFEYLLQELVKFPLYGWREIKIGFRSRFSRSRSVALQAFAAWPRGNWPADAPAALQECEMLEPDPRLKARFFSMRSSQDTDAPR